MIGATQNSQSCASAQPPTKSAGAGAARRVHRRVRHRDADQVDQRQAEADRDRREAAGARPSVAPRMMSRKKNVITTSPTKRGDQRVAAGRVLAVAVRGEAAAVSKPGFAAGDDEQDARAGDGAQHLRDDVRRRARDAGTRRPATRPSVTAGFRWQPEMCPMAIGHRQHGESEGERDAEQADADLGKAAASTALPQPPRTSQNVPRNSATNL